METGGYPETLGALAPKYFKELPIDPFSGEPLRYAREGNGKSYRLYSVGPDRTDDKGELWYDPTNGTVSGGDVLLTREARVGVRKRIQGNMEL